jgi:two-component system sensor histidine kinase UhpB
VGETAPTLQSLAGFEKTSGLLPKGISHPLVVLCAKCACFALFYYVLAALSIRLRFSTSGLSLVWPSNALMVATLVLSRKRYWWAYLLSAVAAHVAALSPHHLGLSWLAYQIAFNSMQAIACAAILQKFRPAILYFETLREVLVFLTVSVVVPGFANLVAVYPVVRFSSRAALLAHNSAAGFIAVWTSCWANNTASLMVFVPVILVCITRGRGWMRGRSWRKVGEGTLLTVLFVILTFLAFGKAGGALPTLYLIPIPFLIWAAVRFGPGGACVSMTLFVCVSSWCAYLGQGPFLRSISIDHVTVLQMCWIMISAPLFCLAAVVQEHKFALENLRNAHSELQRFAPRLISAQEQERQRISRELHDDFGQRLALMNISLHLLDQKIISSERTAEHVELRGVLDQIEELAADVHNMSHQLHSAKLQHLGLCPALKEVCEQLACQHQVTINLTTGPMLESLPEQISLCFYRVAQEALMNAVKHSEASRVDVSLDCTGEILRMNIRDYGIGFAPSDKRKGLGLVSMQERLRMIGGVLRIDSIAGEGTALKAEANISGASLGAA